MDKLHKNWLKMIDGYVVPFLRSKEGMGIIIGILIFIILYWPPMIRRLFILLLIVGCEEPVAYIR